MTKKTIHVKNKKNSGLSEFVKRPLATDEEVRGFEASVKSQHREDEIEENLSAIYKDKKGNLIDVSKLKIKKKKGFWRKLFKIIVILGILAVAGYVAVYYVSSPSSQSMTLELEIISPDTVSTGEEFLFTVNYKNPGDVSLGEIELEMVYPENFIFLDSSIIPTRGQSAWSLPDLEQESSGKITIKGKIINKAGLPNTLVAKVSYIPSNFSSQFRSEDNSTVIIKNIGFDLRADYLGTALVGEEQEMTLMFQDQDSNFVNSFDLVFDLDDNIELLAPVETDNATSSLVVVAKERNTWHVSGLVGRDEARELKFKYKVNDKVTDKQIINLDFSQLVDGERLVFLTMPIELEIMKSDLNLTLAINESKKGGPVNFGDTLNYSLLYNNKGEISMEDVTVMMVIDSPFIDWSALIDPVNGVHSNNSIVWTKEQILALAEIKPDSQGSIVISLPIKEFNELDLGKNMEISSYAQFNMENSEEFEDKSDNRSNTVVNQLNSDLNLDEQIRYFTEENIPVGSGPLPPEVGETTQFRASWLITNNLHDLEDLLISMPLPEYMDWGGQVQVTQGNLSYSASSHSLLWTINNLPVTVHEVLAEFNLTITPEVGDANKILVVSSGAEIKATDVQTRDQIIKKSSATTTKLEEDDVANLSSNGIVKP